MNEDLRRIFSRLLPALFGLGLLQIMTIINLHFASRLGEGVISSIYWCGSSVGASVVFGVGEFERCDFTFTSGALEST